MRAEGGPGIARAFGRAGESEGAHEARSAAEGLNVKIGVEGVRGEEVGCVSGDVVVESGEVIRGL